MAHCGAAVRRVGLTDSSWIVRSMSMTTTLQQEMRRLVQEQPELTCACLIQQLGELGWQLEKPPMDTDLLESTPAWVALLSFRSTTSGSRDMPADPQLVESGTWAHTPGLLSSDMSDALSEFCDHHFCQPGVAPVPLTSLQEPLRQQAINAALEAASKTLTRLTTPTSPWVGEPFVLLMNRCLLRRTYPPKSWRESFRNNNNQHWHQDSNPLFGGRAMVTVWIPLQDGAGRNCPGLETSSVAAQFFSTTCGDSTPDHQNVCHEHGVETGDILMLDIKRGDGAVFNGMTYHRTGLRRGMQSHRDALLLRLCSARDAAYFPGARVEDLPIP